jgi:hypothetical protein
MARHADARGREIERGVELNRLAGGAGRDILIHEAGGTAAERERLSSNSQEGVGQPAGDPQPVRRRGGADDLEVAPRVEAEGQRGAVGPDRPRAVRFVTRNRRIAGTLDFVAADTDRGRQNDAAVTTQTNADSDRRFADAIDG